MADELDGYSIATVYEDSTVVCVFVRRTDDDVYPSGWRYTFHYGGLTAGPDTLDDGTIRRYDNAHEDTNSHELHVTLPPGAEAYRIPRSRRTLRAILGQDSETTVWSVRRNW